MALVTDKNIYFDKSLLKKLDLMVERVTNPSHKLDLLLIFDGYEGYGKSTFSTLVAYYFSYKTGRKFNEDHMFFDTKKLIEFAQSTEKQIIVWDEAALGALSQEYYNKMQIDLIKLLMVVRKKRHIIIFNVPYFNKLKDYFIDRAIGLIHVYAQKETKLGYFCYFNKKNLIYLYDDFRRNKKRKYKKYMKLKGEFPDKMNLVINMERYDKNKDEAILSIGKSTSKDNPYRILLNQLKKKVGSLKPPIKTVKELYEQLGLSHVTLGRWAKIEENDENSDEITLHKNNNNEIVVPTIVEPTNNVKADSEPINVVPNIVVPTEEEEPLIEQELYNITNPRQISTDDE